MSWTAYIHTENEGCSPVNQILAVYYDSAGVLSSKTFYNFSKDSGNSLPDGTTAYILSGVSLKPLADDTRVGFTLRSGDYESDVPFLHWKYKVIGASGTYYDDKKNVVSTGSVLVSTEYTQGNTHELYLSLPEESGEIHIWVEFEVATEADGWTYYLHTENQSCAGVSKVSMLLQTSETAAKSKTYYDFRPGAGETFPDGTTGHTESGLFGVAYAQIEPDYIQPGYRMLRWLYIAKGASGTYYDLDGKVASSGEPLTAPPDEYIWFDLCTSKEASGKLHIWVELTSDSEHDGRTYIHDGKDWIKATPYIHDGSGWVRASSEIFT